MRLSTYTTTVSREGAAWDVHLPALGRSARVGRLSQVEGAARHLVVTLTHADPDAVELDVVVIAPPGHEDLFEQAERARRAGHVPAQSRALVRRLTDAGLPPRDVAHLVGVAFADVDELLAPVAERQTSLPGQRVAHSHDPSAAHPAGSPRAVHQSYRHEAFLYRGLAEFVAGTVDFVRDGVALGQPVMVAVVPERLDALRAALGADAAGVEWVDMAQVGANPARIIPAWRAFVDAHDGRAIRGVGEPVWAGRRPPEVVECQLHEALLNLAVEPDTPLWLRCPYDAEALDADVLTEAARSHPALVDLEEYSGSTSYGGAHHADEGFRAVLPPPSGAVEELVFDSAGLEAVRVAVLARAAAAGLGADRGADLCLAVTEVSTNSVRHGGGAGVLRVWEEDGALVCEVSDAGRLDDLLAGRREPDLTTEGGRGLWLLNQLSDLVQLRSGEHGSTTRIFSWL